MLLVLALGVLAPLTRARRLAAVACLGAAGTTAIYGGRLNWMGMPAAYGVGDSFNLLVGWLLAFSIMDRLAQRNRTAERA